MDRSADYHKGAMIVRGYGFIFAMTVGSVACLGQTAGQAQASFDAIDLTTPTTFDKLIAQLANKRVVFIGETHDRYDHHLNQLEIIGRLHELNSDLAVGIEYLPRTVQTQLDDYIAGRIAEQEFLRSTAYFRNWGYDYRLYAAIFRFAREQRIPVRALNVPPGLASEVAKAGIAGVSDKLRASLPQIEPADEAYRDRLRRAFEAHQQAKPEAFEHFVEAQLVWDEGMAESAASYLNANPERHMVILAGAGHLEFGSGIPKRLERRTHAAFSIVLSSGEQVEPQIADYLLLSKRQELPPAGTLGVKLEDVGGECRLGSLVPGGAAEKGGLKKGEVLVAIDQSSVRSIADVRVALWDKKPHDSVVVKIKEKHGFEKSSEREVRIELEAPETHSNARNPE